MDAENREQDRAVAELDGIALSPDIVLRNYWKEPTRFADVVNAALFEGQQIIRPEELSPMDSDVSSLYETRDKHLHDLNRRRDVLMMSSTHADIVLIGIENQLDVHYAMPLRILGYDYVSYLAQQKELAHSFRKRSGRM